jgi:hypothetical protein
MVTKGSAVVGASSVSGRGLFATKNLPAGELILTIERPLLCVLEGRHLTDTCANCFTCVNGVLGNEDTEKVKLSACSRCKQIKFCGKVCGGLNLRLGGKTPKG